MHPSRSGTTALMLAAAITAAGVASHAAPSPGQPLPDFEARDLNGARHTAREYAAAARRTLLIAITDPDAGPAMRAWFDAADTRAPANVARESIISIRLPFFVPSSAARGRARDQVPRAYWDDTLLDTRGALARRLGLADSHTPYVFVLDESGRVVASAHAPVNSPAARAVWAALR